MSLFVRQMERDSASQGSSTVVLLHGLFGQSGNLLRLAKQLSLQHQVMLVDLPGHGRSADCSFYDLPSMAESVAHGVFDAMRDRGIDRVSLFGHSLGGKVAMQLADRYPESVERLFIADIAPVTYAPSHLRIIDGLLEVSRCEVSSRRDADEVLQAYVSAERVRQFLLKSFIKQESGEWGWQFDVPRISQHYAELIKAPQLRGAFTGDALFIKAEQSDYITDDHQRTISSLYPQAEHAVVHNAGHWLHAEQPDALFDILQTRFK